MFRGGSIDILVRFQCGYGPLHCETCTTWCRFRPPAPIIYGGFLREAVDPRRVYESGCQSNYGTPQLERPILKRQVRKRSDRTSYPVCMRTQSHLALESRIK